MININTYSNKYSSANLHLYKNMKWKKLCEDI